MPSQESGIVQSVGRAFDILEILADSGGEMAISDIAAATGLPLPTIHRLLRTLVLRGYAHQTPRRRYALGARLIPLGELAGGTVGESARPILSQVVAELDESASVAMRDMDRAVYVAHVDSRRSMRMFTEVGRRVDVHATGVGKALLAMGDDAEVRQLLTRVGMRRFTANTITTVEELLVELHRIRMQGYALDAEEQEMGVTCVAVPVAGPVRLAMSVSGPTSRMDVSRVRSVIPVLQSAAERLAHMMQEGVGQAEVSENGRRST